MDKLSRDVFGNVSFTKQLKENKAFSEAKIKVYHNYNCFEKICFLPLFMIKNHCIINFKISLN